LQLDPDLRALQEVRDCVGRSKRACEQVSGYSQEQIDAICKAMADAGARAAYDLARLAVEETGIGRVHYKILKNLLGSEGTWDSIKDEKTVGIVSRDERTGITEVATPVGVVAGIIPTTNPTSTALFKAIIAVKGRNAMVISPHPRARRCINEAVEVLRRAIERAGGPPDLVTCLTNPTIESTGALMKHPKVSIILATGGTGLVEAAYSSGKPAYGVGPGNVPIYVDRSADVRTAARTIVQSQNFDNATLCCSEQALVLDRPIAQKVLDEMVACSAHVCDEAETAKLAKLCNVRGHMNPDVVGQDPWKLAEMAGFSVPRHTTLLLAHQGGVGKDWPLSIEILAPVLSIHMVDGWEDGCRVSMETLHSEGLGHTCGVWASDPDVLEAWFLQKPANRIITNGPCSQGAVGYSTHLLPSMSLGCGPQAGNITSDNISAKHLVNIKRVALPRRDWDDLHRRDHERAASLGGEVAPRGSLLPGDPALGGSSQAPTSTLSAGLGLQSNWQGNAPLSDGPAASAGSSSPRPRAKVHAAPKSPGGSSAPKFTRAASAAPVAVAPPPKQSPSKAATHVGGALSVGEIQDIMSHAGQGCPLGPCQGCPHLNVASGSCTA
jgi:acyl-CoA reductase-like NAD-dependent aldehyde dehydrogenase